MIFATGLHLQGNVLPGGVGMRVSINKGWRSEAKLIMWLCSTDVEILSVKLQAFSSPLRIHRSPPPF